MHKHLTKMGEVTFEKIFNQKLGKRFRMQIELGPFVISSRAAADRD